MSDEALIIRIEKFERTVATCICIVPFLFSVQCFAASIATPIFEDMFADFGSKLSALTEFIFRTWGVWALVSVIAPLSTLAAARFAPARLSLVISTAAGLLMFLIAQTITAALFLPIMDMASVVGNAK